MSVSQYRSGGGTVCRGVSRSEKAGGTGGRSREPRVSPAGESLAPRRPGVPVGGVVNRDSVLRRFDGLTVWSSGDQRAPHKPLLVLYALGQWVQGERGAIPFAEVSPDLVTLLKEFGP